MWLALKGGKQLHSKKDQMTRGETVSIVDKIFEFFFFSLTDPHLVLENVEKKRI